MHLDLDALYAAFCSFSMMSFEGNNHFYWVWLLVYNHEMMWNAYKMEEDSRNHPSIYAFCLQRNMFCIYKKCVVGLTYNAFFMIK